MKANRWVACAACAAGVCGAWAAELALPVATVTERADFRVKTIPGRVTPISRVEVMPQVSGEILDVCFTNGAIVAEGSPLYRIDSVKYAAAVKNAEAKVAECKAGLSYTTLSYQRHQKLVSSHAVSQDAVDNALSARDSARAAQAAAEADLMAARDDLKHCLVTAPISGKIGSTAKTKGNYVKAGDAPLVTLVQGRPIRVRFSLSNRDYLMLFGARGRRIREEARVTLTLADGETFAEDGMVEYVDNEVDESTDTVMVYALFENEEWKLKPGGTVQVTLAAKKGLLRPAIPPMAILQDTQGPYVWVVGAGGLVERRAIARGDLVGDHVFVEKGLKVGERIVADGAHRVRKGMTVRAAK